MNTLAIMIIFGLSVPILNLIGNTLRGESTDATKKAQKDYVNKHPISFIAGTLVGFIPAIIYWIYVITQVPIK